MRENGLDGVKAKDATRQFRLGSVSAAKNIVEKLLSAAVEGDQTREEFLWHKYTNHEDPRIAFEAFRLMLSYAHGKPVEKKEMKLDGPAFIGEVPPKMAADEWSKRYAGGAGKKDRAS